MSRYDETKVDLTNNETHLAAWRKGWREGTEIAIRALETELQQRTDLAAIEALAALRTRLEVLK